VAELALAMLVAFGVLTSFVRVAIQLRRTGTTGLIGLRRDAGPLDWLSGLLFVVGMAMAVASVLLVLGDSLETIDSFDKTGLHVIGIVLAAAGGLAVFGAQLGMGASWRIGVDEEMRTELVTTGWFSLCRNPVYSAMIVGWTGFFLIVPTWLALAAVVVVAVGLEIQVRAVEEPYLFRSHGDEYRAYAARVGRFVPGVGRIG
jgi:protein-S-isoprenylcysteine O-methyltransferase Ste14